MSAKRGTLAWCVLGLAVATIVSCAGGAEDRSESWATGEVTIDGERYPVLDVALEFEAGDDGYYAIHAEPLSKNEDCVPGLGSGMSLYGSIPPSVKSAEDLAGRRLPVEFSGDGDDANLCFVGTDGLLGAREAWVTIEAVDGDRARFSMSGEFERYDDGELITTHLASARGTAQILTER
jgi:hypothetical protein